MQILRFGLLFFILLRAPMVIAKLRRRFSGAHLRIGKQSVEYKVARASKSRDIMRVSIGVQIPDKVRFCIEPETKLDRFCKAIGLAEEWQTRDEAFDRDVFILCDDKVLLRALSQNERLRKAVRDLAGNLRGGRLHCSEGYLWVEVKSSFDKSLDDHVIARGEAERVLPALQHVREEIAGIASGNWSQDRDPGLSRQAMLLILTLAIGGLGLVMLFFQEPVSPPRQLVIDAIDSSGLWTASIASAALILAAVFLLGASSRLHGVLLDVVLVGVPGIFLISHSVTIWQNQHFDKSAAEEHVVVIQSKDIERGRKRSVRYYITVRGWPDPRAGRRIRVSSALYGTLRTPACLRVQLRRGALGDPWISGWEAVEISRNGSAPGGPEASDAAISLSGSPPIC